MDRSACRINSKRLPTQRSLSNRLFIHDDARSESCARPSVCVQPAGLFSPFPDLIAAIVMDAVVQGALLVIKARTDVLVIYASIVGLVLIFMGERLFLSARAK